MRKYKKIIKLAVPVAVENIIYSSINFIDVFMVGKNIPILMLGTSAIAALGITGQVFFIYIVALFGLLSGASVFSAQYFGAKNYEKLKEIGNLLLTITFITSIFVVLIVRFNMSYIFSFYTKDKETLKIAIEYFKIAIYTLPLAGIGFCITMQLRAVNMPKYSLYSSTVALIINVILNYILIYGKFNFPALGIYGAAIATLIARIFSVSYLLLIVKRYELPIFGKITNLKNINMEFLKRFFKISIPTFLHEIAWSIAISLRTAIYGLSGTENLAAIQISGTINGLLSSLIFGVSSACSVIVGNLLGNDEKEKAYEQSKNALKLSFMLGIIIFILLNLVAPYILVFMQVDSKLYHLARIIIFIDSIIMIVGVVENIILIGVLRAGGDIIFSVLVDLIPLWFITLPLLYIVYKLYNPPIYILYSLASMEIIIKTIPSFIRYRSKKWLNNVIN